jgi:chaperonin GroEL (HSP60 family)
MGRGQGIMVTNDGATILKSIYVDNAAAKVLVGGDRRSAKKYSRLDDRFVSVA